jgi:cyclophilin family peptidyl-prolyl cis-trans isomerase
MFRKLRLFTFWLCAGLSVGLFAGCAEEQSSTGLPPGLGEFEKQKKALETPPPPSPPPADTAAATPAPEGVPVSGRFRVKFETTAGDFEVDVDRSWAPIGAQRFHELVKDQFYDGCRFFRVVPNFVAQFGINGDPGKHRKWNRQISDDPVIKSNVRGTLCFATSGPNTRTSQLFINFNDNLNLDKMGFAVFGSVVEGMHNVDGINPQYGEDPNQQMIEEMGNQYLQQNFPELDFIKKASIVSETE